MEQTLVLHVLREAHNALTDYVDRLEKQGGMMGYGRGVIAKIEAIPGVIVKREMLKKYPCRVCDPNEPRATGYRCAICGHPVCIEHRTVDGRTSQHCEDCYP